jgi:ferrous iron transport protein B
VIRPVSSTSSSDAAAISPRAGRRLRAVLAGNPNSGKSTLFNAITGSRQHVGNYPGVTIEKKTGLRSFGQDTLEIVDLPGTYTLAAHSDDERVTREAILGEPPDVVVCVADASNLERSLYLTVQFLELGLPMVLALNMMDAAYEAGCRIDLERLSTLLGDVPVVPTVGSRGEGIEALVAAMAAVGSGEHKTRPIPITYGEEIDREIAALATSLAPEAERLSPIVPRWAALKLIEGDAPVRERVRQRCSAAAGPVLEAADAAVNRLRNFFRDDPEVVIADRRYGFAAGACREAVTTAAESRHTLSDKIDAVVTHPILGIPIFLGLMYLVFFVTFRLGAYGQDGVAYLFERAADGLGGLWPVGNQSPLRSLLVDGVLGGVGSVVSFLPNILILFGAIAVLEDSGYMARAAFIVDRWMHKVGLHGKSFIPMLIGFGCTVPAIMATRILENRRDRLTTMLVLPLVSCGARLPIYTLMVGAFFVEEWRAPVMWVIYLVGILAAALLARLLRSTVFRGETEPFVMELPPYRAPTWKGLLVHVGRRGWMYVRKAGTIILGISVVLWVLTSYPKPQGEPVQSLSPEARQAAELEYSVAGRFGKFLEPVTRLAGFDWRVNTALVGAAAAKEVFVAQMGIVYSLETDDGRESRPLGEILREHYTPLQAVAIMIFCLLGLPCAATVAVMRGESGSWRWALAQWGGLTAMAYGVTVLVYQSGLLLGLGG